MRRVCIGVILLSSVLIVVFSAMFVKEYVSPAPSASSDIEETTLAEPRKSRHETVGMNVGDSVVLPLSEADEKGLISWVAADSSVACIDSGGRVDALKEGVTDVTATFDDGAVYSYYVTVGAAQPAPQEDLHTSAFTANEDILKNNLKKDSERLPYEIRVNRRQNCVTVYTYDSEGAYTVPVRAMICSCGQNSKTTLGDYTIYFSTEWHPLINNVFGQFASSFADDLLFHSVPYHELTYDSLETEEFNKLGTSASKGCVRMAVADCQWICENCAPDTVVKIYDSDEPEPLGRPDMVKITDHNCGWDPTDRHPENPYNKKKPEIVGADDVTLKKGDAFRPADGVSALDTCGSDITDKMEIIGNVVTDRAGTYRVTYRVKDALHRTAEKEITVTVQD